MTLEEIKSILCRDEKRLELLCTLYEEIKSELKDQVKIIKGLELYQQYIKDNSEEVRLKLISTTEYQTFLNQKKELDILKEKIEIECFKCSEQQFKIIDEQTQCNHLFYQTDQGQKVCIKCRYVDKEYEQKKSNYMTIKDLMLKYLYIELSYLYDTRDKDYQSVLDVFRKEPLDHMIGLTLRILELHLNIDNDELQRQLEIEVARFNVGLINQIYSGKESMEIETRKNYDTYIKILINERNKTQI